MRLLVEGETRSEPEWLHTLGVTVDEFSHLLSDGAFRRTASGSVTNDFVGMAATSRELLVSLPKFLRATPGGQQTMPVVLAALAEYWRNEDGHAVSADSLRELHFRAPDLYREYEVYLGLRAYYQDLGAYRPSVPSETRSSNRPVHWPKTLGRAVALHSGGSTHFEPWVHVGPRLVENEVTTLQRSVLRDLVLKYEFEGSVAAQRLQLAGTDLLDGDHLRAHSARHATRVRAERGRAFRSDSVAMLSNLAAYFDLRERLGGRAGAVVMHGTASFHAVWEAACRAVVGAHASLHKRLAQPRWCFGQDAVTTRLEPPGQRPDILVSIKGRDLIVDAKYYYPLPDKLCGWPDLVKQFVYALSYAPRPGVGITNALLFPDSSTLGVRALGFIDMVHDGRRDTKFAPIAVVAADAVAVLAAYASGQQLGGWAERILAEHDRVVGWS